MNSQNKQKRQRTGSHVTVLGRDRDTSPSVTRDVLRSIRAREPAAAGGMEQGRHWASADLVSPIRLSVSYTCRKNCRGIPCSPRMFCVGRQSLVRALQRWCWDGSQRPPRVPMHTWGQPFIPWCSSKWADPSNALIFSQLPETPQLVLSPPARTQPGGSSSEVLAATTDLSQRQASGFSHIARSLSDLG